MGTDFFGNEACRIEIYGYEFNLIEGQRDKDCMPYYGMNFKDYTKEEIITALKKMLSYLELKSDYTNNQT